jgi:hypothetical protein
VARRTALRPGRTPAPRAAVARRRRAGRDRVSSEAREAGTRPTRAARRARARPAWAPARNIRRLIPAPPERRVAPARRRRAGRDRVSSEAREAGTRPTPAARRARARPAWGPARNIRRLIRPAREPRIAPARRTPGDNQPIAASGGAVANRRRAFAVS